jgi:UDP-N-acetylglucosamine--N-acetylmuramyl-(pentapeptide) pyrophosphoryl-undecaprenol N-acetylglucosamine transferase
VKVDAKLILLSAGGTGGHMFPAAALTRELLARGCRVEVVTDSRGAPYENAFSGVKFHVISAGTLGSGLMGKVKGVLRLVAGIVSAFGLVRSLRPAAVVGFGGYPSFPGVFAAQNLSIPTVIHEQNAVLGKANAMLAKRAKRVALSMGSAANNARIVTGNPVRPEIAALAATPYPALAHGGKIKLFIMGGSLGATVFSKVVPAALAELPDEQRARLDITQQCRAADIDEVRAAYAKMGIRARLESFINDVPDVLAACHLVISRSGASTVAEVTAAGRPAIFVPYPHHADQQQKANAAVVADAGGAWVMEEKDFTAEALVARLAELLNDPRELERMAMASRGCGRPDAAQSLANLVIETSSG